jgi:calcium-dependent protein kinase
MGNVMGLDDSSDDENESVASGSMHSNMLRQMKGDDVFKKYKSLEVLGSGSMGFVAKAKIRRNKVGGSAFKKKGFIIKKSSNGTLSERRQEEVLYALKSIILDKVSPLFLEELRNEISILRGLDHPNIIKALEVYDGPRQIYIVLELCDGGDLYKRAPYSEKDSATIMGKLLSAVKYLHDHGIVHRDLKFENIMFESQNSEEIKVIDFGLSKKFAYGEKDIMNEGVGTLYTVSFLC